MAEVAADSLYEAAVLGLRAISDQWAAQPGAMTRIEIRVKGPAVHREITVQQIRTWLEGTCRSPKERLIKERLKDLLGT